MHVNAKIKYTNWNKQDVFGNSKDFVQKCNKFHKDFGLIQFHNLSIDDHIPIDSEYHIVQNINWFKFQ